MKENCNTCDPCEENFWNEVKEIVDNVKNFTKNDNEEKKKEVQDAFSEEESKNGK